MEGYEEERGETDEGNGVLSVIREQLFGQRTHGERESTPVVWKTSRLTELHAEGTVLPLDGNSVIDCCQVVQNIACAVVSFINLLLERKNFVCQDRISGF